ncbi:flagellar hook-length control protein FliK [Alteromonas macleodii]|jgi:flagellar hook-length control protein FliK|uniref:Polar flagellar hook-length control protein FliK n=1 Tax=Alteromonas macleodii (strain English Channel 673) TaxID=1004788 RepID=A0AB32ZVR5_ALTME|nr:MULTISPECIES: flagellar hook-length control protein FliK [Alteromonas]MEC8298169.1 flagellar hook-length control protein FliK [Pseudomonadota bacterium]AFT73688.1 polar flagellar hook-length control protein FliK [Alteromonas macleodii str. 'English Channel 673']MBL3808798.1 flagellar hook-length control protein FliK [Alteromonas macleodii]MBL3882335.1 flagellar hook-length control protein FliK [Alteromonas macleodii]MCG7652087.1 flagellar hook-length control protein FliK [Alteromonas sp. Cn|tara:strand:- start:817 stop:3132 length:2316 start_codon:yes stop_codon:yes gene_type:complete
MQQVAARKTDIAALPFSASGTAKAVGTGIGTQQQANNENNQAFNRLYQDAKTTKSDFVLNEKEDQVAQSRAANRSDRAAPQSSVSSDTIKNGKDRDAGHTDLPVRDEVTDIPAESEADSHNANQEENATLGAHEVAQGSATTTQPSTDGENTNLVIDDAEGAVEQKNVTDAQYVIGEGGRKDAEAGVITSPGTPDGKPSKDDGEPDWIAYVETVANRFGKSDESSGESGTTEDKGISEAAGEAVNVVSIKESGKLWKLPEDVDASDMPSVMAHLLSQLNSNNDGELAIESLSSEAQQTLTALTSLLIGGNANNQQSGSDSETNNASSNAQTDINTNSDKKVKNDNELSALIAKLMQTEHTENPEQGLASDTEAANALSGMLETLNGLSESGKKSADESLVLSLLADELNNIQAKSLDDNLAEAQELLAELTSETAVAGSVAINAAASNDAKSASSEGLLNVENSGEQTKVVDSFGATEISSDLLSAISELSPQSAQKATEAFAERVVAALPGGAQQQAVKANIIAGINEFQQQVQQGREPGIDLSTIVADAAKDAAVSADVVASMTARVDGQASQFLNLMTQTQASAQHAIAGLVNPTESVMQENSQLRAEASKTQQQFEGFDKAVNIHKSDGQQQLSEKIRWMVNARNTMAEIRLDPPELGSMQVRVNVAGDAASVSFVVQSQQAKDALADAMPKLRDMLSEQGIELGDAQVRKDNSSGQENGQQLAGNSHQGQGAGDRGENDGVDDTDGMRVIEQSISRADKGGIDFYA